MVQERPNFFKFKPQQQTHDDNDDDYDYDIERYSLRCFPESVPNVHAQVAKGQSCVSPGQQTVHLSCETYYVPWDVKGQICC